MTGRLVSRLRQVNATRRPEDSVSLRIAVLASVMIAVVAVAVQAAAATADVVAALVALPVGASVSHRRRRSDNTVVKLLLTVGAVLALGRFFVELGGAATIEDSRVPLAGLFLAVQVLHGFDLPQRRDLGFTLVSSLTLVALAATSARGSAFVLVLLPYLAASALATAGLQRAAARDDVVDAAAEEGVTRLRPRPRAVRADGGQAARLRAATRGVAATAAAVFRGSGAALLVGLVVFLLLPRSESTHLGGLPFAGFGSPLGGGRVVNPGLPYGGSRRSPGQRPPFDPSAYFGLAEVVDLRTRGELSDEVVMRVRSERPRFWRGMVFDRYEGSSWSRSAEAPEPSTGVPVRLGPPDAPLANYDPVLQTYELEQQTPNLVFAAAEATQVFHAAGSVSQWDDGTLTTSAEQEAGILYSVVSLVDVTPRERLRHATGPVPEDVARRYLQLPDDLPGRVRQLGRRLTAGSAAPFARAEAVQAWLARHVEYSLDPTQQPPATDAVDWFLFEHRRGWCEQIASSMVLLLRSGGVPARFATGFAPGLRNPFSGWYEVQVDDAHAWVEVWVPGHGWVPFDPTGEVPQAVSISAPGPRLALVDLVRWVRARIPPPVTRTVAGLVQGLRSPAGAATVATVAAGLGLVLLAARRRRAPAAPSRFARLEELLARSGLRRDPSQTPREFVQQVRRRRPDLPDDALVTLLSAEEARRYDPARRAPDEGTEQQALQEVARAVRPQGSTRR
ncbi:MAG TPA: DUF3488 and transglutaminase-like domain-containing protein [Nitriliruptorales bacterium]|nr:DUF3488 and transglutaminase-like domain-containing protein [Nitriliruptorales bacterium]